MSDNVLKKDFNPKDVERLRNLVKGKAGERTSQGIGYTKKEEFHKEGDIWEADGRKWTIKDGIKQNITKLDKFKNTGNWEEHTKNIHNQEIDKTIEEYTQFMEMKMDESNKGFVTEAGEVEKWDGGINKERAQKALKEGIEYLTSLKRD